MDKKYKDRIQRNYVALQRNTNALDLVGHLWENKAISDNDKDKIEKLATRQEQNTELYNAILTKGNHAYTCLIQAMFSTEQGFLADMLVISEEEGLTNSFPLSDVVSEEMPDGNIRFKIRSIENLYVDQESHTVDADREDKTRQTEESNFNVQVKIYVIGFKCAPILGSLSGLDNVVKIKELVEMICGIDVNDQALTYQNISISDTEAIVSACGSDPEISLAVVPKYIFTDSELFSVEVVLADAESEPIRLKVSGDDDIKKLKAKLKLSHPQNVPYYQLYVVFEGKECKEGYSLTECGITEGCTIYCQVRKDYFPLRIRDTSSNAYFTIIVTGSQKIGDLLCSISKTRNVSPTMCELFYRGKRLSTEQTLLETDKFGNFSKTEMKLRFVMPGMLLIKVQHVENGQSMDCYVRWDDAVSSFKHDICQFMNIALENHVLVYAGKTLEDGSLIHQYGINKNSDAVVFVIRSDHLVELSITILINDYLQPTHVLKVQPEATVKDLKLDISRKLLTLYPEVLVPASSFYISVCRTEKTIEGNLTTIQSHGLKSGDELTVIIQLESESQLTDSFFNMNISPVPRPCDILYLPDKGLLKYLSDDESTESGISQHSSYHSSTDEPLSSTDKDFTLEESDGDTDHTPDVSSDTIKDVSPNSTLCDDRLDYGSHFSGENEQDDFNLYQDKEEAKISRLQNKLGGFDSSRIEDTVQADSNVNSTNSEEKVEGGSNTLEENVKVDYSQECNNFSTPTSSYSISQVHEVYSLRSRPNVIISNVSLGDLSDALKEENTDKEYNTCQF